MRPRDRERGPPENRESRPAGTGAALEKRHTYTRINTIKTGRQQDQACRCSPALQRGGPRSPRGANVQGALRVEAG